MVNFIFSNFRPVTGESDEWPPVVYTSTHMAKKHTNQIVIQKNINILAI